MVICLDGELGSGKTLFTKAFAQAMEVKDAVTSPTFTIIKEYEGDMPLYHMDVYRLDDDSSDIGIEEYFYKGGICIIEWADNIKDILRKDRLDIKIKVVDENKRCLVINAYGKEYEELCEAVL
jgi:tRNA threonylcarbamoyladenosine biosynthesis protein TsaE